MRWVPAKLNFAKVFLTRFFIDYKFFRYNFRCPVGTLFVLTFRLISVLYSLMPKDKVFKLLKFYGFVMPIILLMFLCTAQAEFSGIEYAGFY